MAKSQVLHGFHAVTARLRTAPQSVLELYLDRDRNDARARSLRGLADSKGVRVMAVERGRLDGLAPASSHQGVVAMAEPVSMPQFLDDVLENVEGMPFLLLLDGVQDPHNLGACLRVADGAGVHAVVAPKDRSVGLTHTAMKVASGAAEHIPYITVTNLARTIRELKERDIYIIGTDDDATQSVHQVDLNRPVAWVLGAEGEGMRRLTRELCDTLVAIPMAGAVESLNVSVAAGICLYETVRQRTTAASAPEAAS